MALTRMPYSPTSNASDFVKAVIPAFDVQYGAASAPHAHAHTDEMFTMLPDCCAIMVGRTARQK